jgi:hypothetical protein
MGLLDRALRGATPPPPLPVEKGGGFLVKANASREPRAIPTESARESGPSGAPVRESSGSVDAVLAALRAELLRLPLKSDYLFILFTKLRSALPFDGLALFLACDDGLRLAAEHGFQKQVDDPLPFSAFASILEPGKPADDSLRSILSAILEIPADSPVRLSVMRNPSNQAITGLWVYAYSGPDGNVEGTQVAIGATMLACAGRATRIPSFWRTPSDLVASLIKSIPPDRCAVAMIFYLSKFSALAKEAFPGLRERSAISLAVDTAAALLGNQGRSVPLPASRMALILTSTSSLDAELTLFQMRKSFSRCFSFLTGSEAPSGESFSFDPAGSGSVEALGRFIAG